MPHTIKQIITSCIGLNYYTSLDALFSFIEERYSLYSQILQYKRLYDKENLIPFFFLSKRCMHIALKPDAQMD